MKLTRGKKIALAAATVWLPLFMVFYLGVIMFSFLSFATMTRGAGEPKGIPMSYLVMFPLQFLTMVLGIGLIITYVVHALQNEKLNLDNRLLWAVLIVVGTIVTMPVYFYRYVLPLQDDAG